MKKHILAAVAGLTCTFALTLSSLGQSAVFSYNDGIGAGNAGTYNPSNSFTFAISLAFTPGGAVPNIAGLSYWFEQQNPGAPFNFSITNRNLTGSPFSDPQTPGIAYPQSLTPSNSSDLGASLPSLTSGLGAGNYFIANLTIFINPNTAAGTYFIENTINGGKISVITDNQGHTSAIGRAIYAITVVPEGGSTALLLGMGVLGLAVLGRRLQRA
jgi:hypothetical protein